MYQLHDDDSMAPIAAINDLFSNPLTSIFSNQPKENVDFM